MAALRKEKQREAARRYRSRHPDRVREQQRRYSRQHKDKRLAATKRWREQNPHKVKYWQDKYRFKRSLYMSKRHAIELGYCPCSATESEVRAAFTGRCHVCGAPEAQCGRRLHLDHDHTTGRFRGWLCGSCNLGLGKLGEDESRVESLLNYLRGKK